MERVEQGEPFSSRHRIVDTQGRTHWVIVVSDRMLDGTGTVIGTAGFYIDVTEVIQANVSTALSDATPSRAVIEQAKGVLMATYGISTDQAFDVLVWHSQETNIKLRELAHRFLAGVTRRLPPDAVAQIDNAVLTVE